MPRWRERRTGADDRRDRRRPQAFLIEDPGRVAITAGAEGPVDMVCGAQKTPARVEISYDRPRAGQSGIEGIVRTLAF